MTKINLVLPTLSQLKGMSAAECIRGVSEGILLTNYKFERLYSIKEETILLKSVQLIGMTPKMMTTVKEAQTIAEGVYLSRDLTNGNAYEITPDYLAKKAKQIAAKHTAVKATILDRAHILKEKMGLLAAVASGSPLQRRYYRSQR